MQVVLSAFVCRVYEYDSCFASAFIVILGFWSVEKNFHYCLLFSRPLLGFSYFFREKNETRSVKCRFQKSSFPFHMLFSTYEKNFKISILDRIISTIYLLKSTTLHVRMIYIFDLYIVSICRHIHSWCWKIRFLDKKLCSYNIYDLRQILTRYKSNTTWGMLHECRRFSKIFFGTFKKCL